MNRFDRARKLADAVLLEGYVLYPYRASSKKNRFRWAFGVLAPKAWSEADPSEPWWLESQCLLDGGPETRVEGRLRLLQQQVRTVEASTDGTFRPAESLEVDGKLHIPWEEGVVQEIAFAYRLCDEVEVELPWAIAGGRLQEDLCDATGRIPGRIVRERMGLRGRILLQSEPCGGPLYRLRIRVENQGTGGALGPRREEMLPHACIATHLLLGVDDGAFVSLLDPPEGARGAAAETRSVRTYPVLASEAGRRDLVLSAPIILYDHPNLAPESGGDFFDATEIDEMLTLRTSTLTPEEKREARATDPRAAALIDRVEQMSPSEREGLHGALRDVHRGEMVPRSARSTPAPGTRVRLKPSRARRTDAQDFLFEGLTATVEAVLTDVDDREYVAVTLDADPASELHRWYGRFFYYYLDELEPLAAAPVATGRTA